MKNRFLQFNNVKPPYANNPVPQSDAAQVNTAAEPTAPISQPGLQPTQNKLNAQHSTGPTTDAGKAISKLNATVHNLRGQFRLLPHEDTTAYVISLQCAMQEYAPEGMRETKIVIQLVHCQWQIDRTADHLYNAQAYSDTLEEQVKLIDKFSLYRQRFLREQKTLLRQLQTLQLQRSAQPAAPLTNTELETMAHAITQLDAETLASFVQFNTAPPPLLPRKEQIALVDQLEDAKKRLKDVARYSQRDVSKPLSDTEKAIEHLADLELALE